MPAPRTVLLRAVAATALAFGAPVVAGCGDSKDDKPAATRTTSAAENAAADAVSAAKRVVQAAPSDPAGLERLIDAHVQLAYLRGNVSANTIGPAANAELRRAAAVWDRYLALHPRPPDVQTATLMARAFGQSALNDPRAAIRASRVAAENTRPPNATLYSQLAVAYYGEKLYRQGDRAAARAIALTGLQQRANLRRTLRQIRSQEKTQGA